MSKVIALLIVLAGAAGGLGLGLAFGPGGLPPLNGSSSGDAGRKAETDVGPSGGHGPAQTSQAADASTDGASEALSSELGQGGALDDRTYVKLGRAFVIPIVDEQRTEALMQFDLALDVPAGMTQRAYAAEPRLRDAFLQTLLELSYTGAFSQTYTDERITRELREKLRADAQRLLEGTVYDVLILDMLRQEL